MAPLDILGGAAIPMILLAFGMSLHGTRPLRRGEPRAAVGVASAAKLVVMPVVAFVVSHLVLGLDDAAVASAVTLAALPTAQNVDNYAARFGRGEILAQRHDPRHDGRLARRAPRRGAAPRVAGTARRAG